jgi:hypothetical protein
MTKHAQHVLATTEPANLKWALRQVRISRVNVDAVAMALRPAGSPAELRAVAQGLRDLSVLPAEMLPETVR